MKRTTYLQIFCKNYTFYIPLYCSLQECAIAMILNATLKQQYRLSMIYLLYYELLLHILLHMRSLDWPTNIMFIMFIQGHYFICPCLPVTLNLLACVLCKVHTLVCFHTLYCRVCYLQLLYLFYQNKTCFCTLFMLNAVPTRNSLIQMKVF